MVYEIFVGDDYMKPIIGITSEYGYDGRTKSDKVKTAYIEAITLAGGIPLILPIIKDNDIIERYFDLIDGILFTGGEDLSPLLYDESPMKEVLDISYDRDYSEMELFKGAYKRRIPILGICRGLQLINVALGGSLYQDIHTQLPHALGHMSTYDISAGYHRIKIVDDTVLYDILGVKEINVNSNHHQSVKDLGKGLRINCLSKEGIIEGIESIKNSNFVLGVQFHPEAMMYRHEKFINIFEYFVLYCM